MKKICLLFLILMASQNYAHAKIYGGRYNPEDINMWMNFSFIMLGLYIIAKVYLGPVKPHIDRFLKFLFVDEKTEAENTENDKPEEELIQEDPRFRM